MRHCVSHTVAGPGPCHPLPDLADLGINGTEFTSRRHSFKAPSQTSSLSQSCSLQLIVVASSELASTSVLSSLSHIMQGAMQCHGLHK